MLGPAKENCKSQPKCVKAKIATVHQILHRNNDEKSSVCCGCQRRIQGRGFLDQTEVRIVSLAAVFSIVTQRSSRMWGGALRDGTKNGCEGD